MPALMRLMGAAALMSSGLVAAELHPHTIRAFDSYIKGVESEMDRQVRSPKFLHLDQDAGRLAAARKGELQIWSPAENPIAVRDGLIHDWTGAIFIPGATLAETLKALKNYNNHKNIYGPEVEDSKLLNQDGDKFKIYLRLRKTKVLTVILNTEHDVRYYPLDATRVYSKSYSTRIAEVENAGSAGESEKRPGHDNGFLWKLYSYWRFAERDGGVYLECRAISLSRGIPFGTAWIVEPIIKELPRESLEKTLLASRKKLKK